MDPDLKKRWVDALRSGKYKQGVRQLRDREGRYCCLGVLYEVHSGKTPPAELYCMKSERDAGLDSGSAWVLMGMNDSGSSFHEIADYIEENL